MENHLYEGTWAICSKCYKRRDHALHTAIVSTVAVSNSPDIPSAIELADKQETIDTFDANGRKSGQREITVTVQVVVPQVPTCNGHACPRCGNSWSHDYDCFNRVAGLCKNCAQQQSAIINRPENIRQIKENGERQLSGMEEAEIRTRSRETVKTCVVRDPKTGEKYDDWQDKLSIFIKGKMASIERLRIEIGSALEVRTEEQEMDVQDLPLDERERREKAGLKAKRPKKAASEKPAKPAKTPQELWKDRVQNMAAQIVAASNNKLTNSVAETMAEKFLKDADNAAGGGQK